MSTNINMGWKKNLQTFLKGQGKLNTDSFKDKAVVLMLQEGNAQMLPKTNVLNFLQTNKLQPNMYFILQVIKKPDGLFKTVIKEGMNDNANLFIVSNQQENKVRSKMFDLQNMQYLYFNNKSAFNQKMQVLRNFILSNPSKKSLIKLTIADKLSKVCPLIYIQLFMTNNCQESDKVCELLNSSQSNELLQNVQSYDTLKSMQSLCSFLEESLNIPNLCKHLEEKIDLSHNQVLNILDNITTNGDNKDMYMFYVMIQQEQGQLIQKECDSVSNEVCTIFMDKLLSKLKK